MDPITALLIGSIASSVFGVGGTIASSVYNRKSVDAANDANLQAVREMNKANAQAIDKMNAYNDLRNIIKQYDAVGLNRNLISGLNPMQQSASTAIPSHTIPHQISSGDMQGVYNAADSVRQFALDKANIQQQGYQNRLLEAQAVEKEIENVFRPQLLSGQIDMNHVQIDNIKQGTSLSYAEERKLYTQINEINKSMDYMTEQIKLCQSQTQSISQDVITKRIENYIRQNTKDASIKLIMNDMNMSSAQLSEYLAQSIQRGELMDYTVKSAKYDAEFKQNNVALQSFDVAAATNNPDLYLATAGVHRLTSALGGLFGAILHKF